jgi:hypothetical protein
MARRSCQCFYRARWGRSRLSIVGDSRDAVAATELVLGENLDIFYFPVGWGGWGRVCVGQRRWAVVLEDGEDMELIGAMLLTSSERKKTMVFFWPVGPSCQCYTKTVCRPGSWWAGWWPCWWASIQRPFLLFYFSCFDVFSIFCFQIWESNLNLISVWMVLG